MPADAGVLFYQIDLMTGAGYFQSRLNTGDAAADHQDIRINRYFLGLQRLLIINPSYGSTDQGFGFFGGFLVIFMHPGTMFPDICHFKKVLV